MDSFGGETWPVFVGKAVWAGATRLRDTGHGPRATYGRTTPWNWLYVLSDKSMKKRVEIRNNLQEVNGIDIHSILARDYPKLFIFMQD